MTVEQWEGSRYTRSSPNTVIVSKEQSINRLNPGWFYLDSITFQGTLAKAAVWRRWWRRKGESEGELDHNQETRTCLAGAASAPGESCQPPHANLIFITTPSQNPTSRHWWLATMFGASVVRQKRERERRERALKELDPPVIPYIKPFGARFDASQLPYFKYRQALAELEAEKQRLEVG